MEKVFERNVVIEPGVNFNLTTYKNENKYLTYGVVIYEDGLKIPFGNVVTSSPNYNSYYIWTKEHIYKRSDLGTFDREVVDIKERKKKKIYISRTDRKYEFGIVHTGNNRSVNFDQIIDINDETKLLLNRFWSGSDLCEKAYVVYSDGQINNLNTVILCTPSDYEVPNYYVWDEDYVYTCYNDNSDNLNIEEVYDIKNRKIYFDTRDFDASYVRGLIGKNRELRRV